MHHPDIPEGRRPAVTYLGHPTQRYFAETDRNALITGSTALPHLAPVRAVVMRHAERNEAELELSVNSYQASLRMHLSPVQLRRLASDLLDAAVDIERTPAPAPVKG